MDELIAFITARLDEDEAAAKAAWPGPWDLETQVGGFGPVSCVLMPIPQHKGARTGLTSFTPLGTQDADTAAHIARHDPARVLREVAAKRAILAEHIRMNGGSLPDWCLICRYRQGPVLDTVSWPCPTVRQLAAVWSDHADYRPDWSPVG